MFLKLYLDQKYDYKNIIEDRKETCNLAQYILVGEIIELTYDSGMKAKQNCEEGCNANQECRFYFISQEKFNPKFKCWLFKWCSANNRCSNQFGLTGNTYEKYRFGKVVEK